MKNQFVSPHATIAELEKKAAQCEREAEKSEEPRAAELRKEAKACRDWARTLRTGPWSA